MGGLSGLIRTFTGSAGAKAARQAGQLQAEATEKGIEETSRQFDITQERLAPFQQAGERALTQQEALLGLAGPEAEAAAREAFTESPGQKFLRERQERALLRNTSVIGGLGGGNVKTDLQEQAAGIAAQQEGTQFNRLAGISGAGQQAVGVGGQLGAQSAGQISRLLGEGAQAQAGGILGAQQARSQGLSNLLKVGAGAALGGTGALGGSIGAGQGALLGLL